MTKPKKDEDLRINLTPEQLAQAILTPTTDWVEKQMAEDEDE